MRIVRYALFIQAMLLAADTSAEIPLWPQGAPGSPKGAAKESILQPGRIAGIHNPTVTVFLPPRDNATGAAMIIAPGGAHRYLTIENEGYDVARWFASNGVAGFVLKYRLAHEEGSTYKVEVHALQDAQRAIRLVRSRAAEWRINPKSIGIMGFSAGGELAALAATRFDDGIDDPAEAVDRQSSRPDFEVLIYPGFPRDWQPGKDTPPTFLLCAANDRPSISEGSAQYYLALKKAGVPVELHIYSNGGHGFGIRNRPLPVSSWPARVHDWLNERGFLKKP